MVEGGCYCGAIRYRVTGTPFHATHCHCSICRRTTGGTLVTWFSVTRDGFRLLRGEPRRFQSSAKGTRGFCAACGTQLTFEHADLPDVVDVTTASLDDPHAAPPKDHTHTSSRLRWLRLADGLREYRESRREE